MRKVWKQPTFVMGFLFVFVMLVGSLVHWFVYEEVVPNTPFLYDENGELVGAPFPPFVHSILGTDLVGNHLFYFIVKGAKYTILGTLAIAGISFLVAWVIGVPLGFYQKKKWFQGLEQTISVLYFIPASLITYIFLRPLLIEPPAGFPTSLGFRLAVEVLVIGLLLVPPAAILMANETAEVLKSDYVATSRTLGGRGWHLYRRHVYPKLKTSWVRLFMVQSIQAVLILTHMGVFKLYFGGTSMHPYPFQPITHEWGSLVGKYYDTIMTSFPWLLGIPLIFVVLFVLSIIGIGTGIERVMKLTREKKRPVVHSEVRQAAPDELFEWVD